MFTRSRRKGLVWVICLLACMGLWIASCDTAGKACTTDLVCASGQICLNKVCTVGCRSSFACPTGTFCFENQCGPDACTPGKSRACYNGKEGTLGTGTCKAGLQFCDDKGRWSLCSGEMTSQTESCDREDNDCNGLIDDGINCDCTPGTERACYAGSKGTIADGRPCQAGVQACLQDKQWGKCRDQRLPEPEVCGITDNDCDGSPDNGLVCRCQNGETRPCYDGPANTVGSGICKVGKQSCKDSKWGGCVGAVKPVSEGDTCNNLDDDCNGYIDDLKGGKVCRGELAPDGGAVDLSLPEFSGDSVVSPLNVLMFPADKTRSVTPQDIAVDKQGNVYVVGSFSGPLFSGKHKLEDTTSLSAAMFVVKFDQTGTIEWSQQTIGAPCTGSAIAVNEKGEVFLTGFVDARAGGATFGGMKLTVSAKHTFVAKLKADGTPLLFVAPITGTTGIDQGASIAVANGLVYVLGHFQGTVMTLRRTLKSNGIFGAPDIYLLRMKEDLSLEEEYQFGGNMQDQPGQVVAVPGGKGLLYFSGQMTGIATVPAGVVQGSSEGSAFVAEFDPKTKRFRFAMVPCSPSCFGTSLALVPGGLLLTGRFKKEINKDGASPPPPKTTKSESQCFVARLNQPFTNSPHIQHLEVSSSTDINTAQGLGIIGASSQRSLVVGVFKGAGSLGSHSYSAASGNQLFVGLLDATMSATGVENTGNAGLGGAVTWGRVAGISKGFAWIVGRYSGEVELANGHVTKQGTNGMFLMKLQVAP